MLIDNPNRGAHFRALTAEFPPQGRPIELNWLHAWATAGLGAGEYARVADKLAKLINSTSSPAVRATLIRLRGTALWRERRLPEAAEAFRQGLSMMLEVEVATASPPKVEPAYAYTPEKAAQPLWNALAALAQGQVRAFATAGTLLGLEREGRLLAHDKDIDIGLPLSELPSADRILRKSGWRRNDLGHRFVNFLSYADPATGIELDIIGFLPLPAAKKWLSGFWVEDIPWEWQRVAEYPAPGALLQSDSPAGPIRTLPDPDTWLTSLYGDWRTPDTQFDTVISARNLLGFSLLTQCYAYSRILIRWLNAETPRALSLTRQVLLRHTPDDDLLLRVEKRLVGGFPDA